MAKTEPKPQIREALKSFARETFQSDLGNLNDKQRSLALLSCYIQKIHNPLRSYISPEDLETGFVDQADDLGADFMNRDDGTNLIIQVKYHKPDFREEADKISYFQGVLERLHSQKFKRNSRVAEMQSEIDWEKDYFTLKFISLGQIAGATLELTKVSPKLPKDVAGIEDRVSCEFLDETDLTNELRQALSLAGGLPGETELIATKVSSKRSPVIEIQAGDYRSCVLIVDANQIVNLYKHHGLRDSLFTVNIRNYIGDSKTNKRMMETARETPQQFYHFNNGISCLTTELTVQDDRVTTKGLQVINGAQTVKSLVKVYEKSPWQNKETTPLLLVRITEVTQGYGPERKFKNEVTRNNNTQNQIKDSDFRSNDPIQNDLKEKFDKCRRSGRVVSYIPKRTDTPRPNSFPVRLEEFAKVIYSFLCDPVSFSGSTSFLFDENKDGYVNVFGDGKDVYVTMPDKEFELRSAIWWMANNYSVQLKKDRESAQDSFELNALERKWMVIFTSRLVLERSFGKDNYQSYLRKYYQGEWTMGEGPEGKWFGDIYDRAKRSVVFVYKEAAKDKNFVHRNWMRSKITVEDIKRFVLEAPFSVVKPPGQ